MTWIDELNPVRKRGFPCAERDLLSYMKLHFRPSAFQRSEEVQSKIGGTSRAHEKGPAGVAHLHTSPIPCGIHGIGNDGQKRVKNKSGS